MIVEGSIGARVEINPRRDAERGGGQRGGNEGQSARGHVAAPSAQGGSSASSLARRRRAPRARACPRRKAQRQGDARARGERRRHVDEHQVEPAGRQAHRLAGRQAELREPYHALQTALVDVGMDLHGAGSRRRAAEQAVGRARIGYGEIGGGRACARRRRADPSVGDRQRPGRGRASRSESEENEGTLEVSHESNSRDNESPSYRNARGRRALGTFRRRCAE